MNIKFLPIILLIIVLNNNFISTSSNFENYPEEVPLDIDFVPKSGEIVYNSYYWSKDSSKLTDSRNGVLILPFYNCDETIKTPTFSTADSIEGSIPSTDTWRRNLLKNTMTSPDISGIFCNFDNSQLIYGNSNKIKIYIWVINSGSASATFKLKGCDYTLLSCVLENDYIIEVGGGKTYTINQVQIEEISIEYEKNFVNSVYIELNGDTANGKDVYFDKTNFKLMLQLTLDTEVIKLSYLQYNLVTIGNNLLKGSGTCTNNLDCLPGYVCTDSTCGGKIHPACATGSTATAIEFKSSNDYLRCLTCSQISSKYNLNPSGGSCNPINHLDITQFANISFNFRNKYSDSYTMGLWLFIEDISLFGDNIINFTLNKVMMISIGRDGTSPNYKAIAYCNPHILYYPNIAATISKTAMDTISTNTKYATNKQTLSSYLDNKWFHVRCAINLAMNSNYLLIDNSNMVSSEVSEVTTMNKPYYYDSVEVDYDYRYINSSSTTTITITNASSLYSTIPNQTSVFIKNLIVNTDIMPKTSGYHYYNWSSLSNNNYLPSLYFIFDGDTNLTATSIGYTAYAHYSGTKTTATTSSQSFNTNATFKIPNKFYRLVLADPNIYYTTTDFDPSQIDTLTGCISNSYCYKNSNQINCPSSGSTSKYLKLDGTCSSTCDTNYMPQYGSTINSNVSSGYCTLACSVAPYANTNCVSSFSTYFSSFSCKDNFTRSHLKCIDDNDLDKGALNYSRYFNYVPTITIPVSPTLTNYYLEVWYFADKVFTPTSSSATNYIWQTNTVSVTRGNNYSLSNTYAIKKGSTTIGSTFTYQYGNWYRIAYNVKLNSSTYSLTYFYNKYGGNITGTNSDLSLSNIYFCNNVNCGGVSSVNWASGFYRNLRVWDSTYIYSSDVFKDFDRYLGSFEFSFVRFNFNTKFYPFTLRYLTDKLIRDPDKSADITPTNYPTELSTIYFAPYYYSVTFDKRNTGQYISSFTTTANLLYEPAYTNCSSNCKNCNHLECFECEVDYYLKEGVCVSNTEQKYYLRSPVLRDGVAVDLKFNAIGGIVNSFSCSFFVKLLGWTTSGTTFDLFKYGSGLKLTYTISSGILTLNDGTTNFATFSNFFSLQGKWVNISLSYYYKSSINSYYPAMMNFQINAVNLTISGTYSNLTINDYLMIPKESIAVYGKIWIWDRYINGAWSEMSNSGRQFEPVKFLIDNITTSACIDDADLNLGVLSSPIRTCLVDYDVILDQTTWCTTNVSYADTTGCQSVDTACKYGYYTIDTSVNICGCPSDNIISDFWIKKNSNLNKCKLHDYVDFAQMSEISLSAVSTGSNEYTIEFWLYLNTYTTTGFNTYLIQWDKQMKIKLDYASSSLRSTCYPFYDSTDSTKEGLNSESINFSSKQWIYLRCSVSKTAKTYFHFHETLITSELILNGTGPTVPATTTLILTNNSINRGLIYFRQFRLWKCYLCQNPDTYKLDITASTIAFYSNLLHMWDPVYTGSSYPGTVTDLKGSKDMSPAVDSGFIGYNIIDDSNYSKLVSPTSLCVETLQSCTGLLKFNQVEDLNIPLEPARFGRYTIEFWTMFTDATSLTEGFHIKWNNLVSISIVKDPTSTTGLNIYCWPQDFKRNLDETFGSQDIQDLTETTLNYDRETISNYTANTWTWIRCAVTHNKDEFYLNQNTIKNLTADVMWKNQSSDHPMRYFWQNNENSAFIIKGAGRNSGVDIYIKHVYLFEDYIPQNYDFKHMDLTKLNQSQFPSLVWSMNTSAHWKQLNKIPYTDKSTTNISFNPVKLTTVASLTFTYLLEVKTMCDPTGNTKYIGQDNCQSITSCDLAALSASYCIDENKPLVCASGYHWDELKFINDPSTVCVDDCTGGNMRSPNSSTSSAICNSKCGDNYLTCPGSASQETNLYSSLTCTDGYDRYNYQCLDKTTSNDKAFLYFNGCTNFPNLFYDSFTNNSDLKNGYVLTFWIKLDRMNEFCNLNSKKKFYFLLEPHSIYLDTTSTKFSQTNQNIPTGYYNIVYEMTKDSNIKGTLFNFSTTNWNFITIHVNLISKFLRVYSNYHYFSPDLNFENLGTNILDKLSLQRLLFCSIPGSNSNNNICSPNSDLTTNLGWGAAFYKNIKIFDGVNANPWVALESELRTYSDNLFIQYYDFPLNIANSIDNKIKNLKMIGDGINSYSRYNYGSTDKDLLINYSSKFDYTLYNPGEFVNKQELINGSITTGKCSLNCKRCINNGISGCTECLPGAKLFSSMCKPYSGYFLKTPMENHPEKYLSLNLFDLRNNYYLIKENKFTITIWIKLFGQLESSKSTCIIIFRFKADGSTYICYNISDFNLYFYHNNNILYKDATFNQYLGQWTLISFSSFIHKQPNIPLLEQYFNYLYRFYVHNQEVVKSQNYSINAPGLGFDSFDIGNEFSALFYDLRIYRDFIVNPYGYIMGIYKNIGLVYNLKLMSDNVLGKCLTDFNINIDYYNNVITAPSSYINSLGIDTVADYSPYIDSKCGTDRWFDINQIAYKDPPCGICSSSCTTQCAYSTNSITSNNTSGCTCTLNQSDNFLKINSSTQKLNCEGISQFDFSRGTTIADKIKVSSTSEYSIEFWFYIYSYNKTKIEFDSHEIIWDLHNYIKIYNINNTLNAHCSPVYDNRNRTAYIGEENINESGYSNFGYDDTYRNSTSYQDSNGDYFKWVYLTCSTSVPRNVFYMNSQLESPIRYQKSIIPNLNNTQSTKFTNLIIQPGYKSKANFGFLFIREIKLWSIYDIRRFTTKCKLGIDTINYYKDFLIHQFINDKPGTKIYDNLNNLISGELIKRSDFVGFNIIEHVTAEDLKFNLIEECSMLNIFPNIGVNNSTRFVIQSREIQQILTNSYRFYYKIKDTIDIVEIKITKSIRETDFIFNIDEKYFGAQIGNLNKEIVFLEIYCDVIFYNEKLMIPKIITLFKLLTIYKNFSFINTFSYDLILSNVDLNNEISNKQILHRTEVLNYLQSDKINSTIENFPGLIRKISNKNVDKNNFTIFESIEPTCQSFPNFCNNRGYCYKFELNLFCVCYILYTGDNCQISKNNSATLIKVSDSLLDMINYRVSNNSLLEDRIDVDVIHSIQSLINLKIKLNEKFEDMNPFMNIMETLFNSTQNVNLGIKFSESFDNTSQILNDLFKFYYKKINFQKYQNFVKFIVNKDNNGTIGLDEIKYQIEYVNLNKSTNVFSRLLQENINNNNFILNINNTILLTLTDDQINTYFTYFSKLRLFFINFAKIIINSNKNGIIDYKYSSDQLNFILKKIDDINGFDFNNFFINNINNFESYFDANECFKDNINQKSPIFLFYLNFKINDRPYIKIESNYTSSPSIQIIFFDKDLNNLLITCKEGKEIIYYTHLFEIYDKELISDITNNPSKYREENLAISTGKYYPKLIFKNGTINHSNITEQIEKYYTHYQIKHRNNFSNTNNFKSINLNGYIKTTSNSISEYNLLTSKLSDRKFYDNFYFINHPEILDNSENYKNNMGFYIIIFLISFYISALFILILIYLIKNNKNEKFIQDLKNEFKLIEKDNLILSDNRYSFYYNYDREINLSQLNNSIIIDDQSNKSHKVDLFQLEEEKESVRSQNVEINKNNNPNILENNFIINPTKINLNSNPSLNSSDSENKNYVFSRSKNNKLEMKDFDEVGHKVNTSEKNLKYSESESSVNNIENNLVKIQIKNTVNTITSLNIILRHNTNSNRKFYNVLYFILFRNIYVNNFTMQSPFNPTYKKFCKFLFFIFLLFVTVTITLIFLDTNLFDSENIIYSKMVSYIFISIFFSNFVLICINYFLSTGSEIRMKIINLIENDTDKNINENKEITKEINKMKLMNMIKVMILGLFNFGLAALLFYLGVGFCAVWIDWDSILLILWAFLILTDFIIMEVILEILILIFYALKKKAEWLKKIYKILLALKNLRNLS